jgi:hypothetical protein
MANSIAYVLSKNTYPDAYQAGLIGVSQGTQIVYATTSTLTSANVLFADSRLTQPIYGDGISYYGVQLLNNTAVEYAINISDAGVISISSPPTTTTTSAPSFSWVMYTAGPGDSQNICNQVGSTITLYTSTGSLAPSVQLYTNSSLSTPWDGVGPGGTGIVGVGGRPSTAYNQVSGIIQGGPPYSCS